MSTHHQLSICGLVSSEAVAQTLSQALDDRFSLVQFQQESDFRQFLEQEKHDIDCLVLESSLDLPQVACYLHKEATLLPAIVLLSNPSPSAASESDKLWHEDIFYHTAELQLPLESLPQISSHIEQAIARFLQLTAACRLPLVVPMASSPEMQDSLNQQQQNLSEKLKERLGYLGLYYKRDPHLFLRHMPEPEKQDFLREFKLDYREIVLNYFNKENSINPKIDAFVTKAFFADISVSQILEIHMELMDSFAKQLRLEGRSEDILLDYRLTLIDVIAHLCEMYRRSIPRETQSRET
uniref:Circadian clock oscillator protein KaiA n=1 Tax=Cyanothece sp. (strain PCC 7425 / ATCC 29141) TaxID=395961 RepID=B8HSU1_CYAP4